jgi:hypothetical protein
MTRSSVAPLAPADAVLKAFRREHAMAVEEMDIHHATCRARHQRLACSHCYVVAERRDQAGDRLERAERIEARR